MKKLTCILLIISLIFAFSACSGNKEPAETADPSVVLKTEVSEAAPGEEVRIILNVKNIHYFASGDISVSVSGNAVYTSKTPIPNGELHMEANAADNVFNLGAYVATTIELPDNDLYELTYTVNDDAEIGSVIEFTPSIRSFSVGTDETGDETKSVMKDISLEAVSITVK